MPLLGELLHVLGSGAAGARLEEAAASQQGHDRKHLGRGSELDDREEVGEIVAQHISRDRNGVLARARARHRRLDGVDGLGDGDVKARSIVILEVGLHLVNKLRVVRPALVQPEDCGIAGGARAVDGKLHPIADRLVLGLAHAPDVALLDLVRHERLTGTNVDHAHSAGRVDLKRLVVRAVLLRLLRHQPHVGDGAHRRDVELAVGAAVVKDSLVHGGVAPVGDHANDILQLVVLVPHLARVAHDARHRRVDDNVRWHVQIGDSARRVDHREARAAIVAGGDARLDLAPVGR
mmetsp:Transcript_13744/g.41849  ORF Transcript_13744/g.41849 Transcript_13744/m.41849 type:complete len:292 (+) Transcript_13744:549-1424(+)